MVILAYLSSASHSCPKYQQAQPTYQQAARVRWVFFWPKTVKYPLGLPHANQCRAPHPQPLHHYANLLFFPQQTCIISVVCHPLKTFQPFSISHQSWAVICGHTNQPTCPGAEYEDARRRLGGRCHDEKLVRSFHLETLRRLYPNPRLGNMLISTFLYGAETRYEESEQIEWGMHCISCLALVFFQ